MSIGVYTKKIEEYVQKRAESKSTKKPTKGLLAPKMGIAERKPTTQLEAVEKVGEFVYTIRRIREEMKAGK